jgi:hypothetical protein
MDDALYASLGRRAAMENRSISQQVVEIVQRYLSAPAPNQFKCADEAVLELAGSWKDDRTAEEIVADIRKSRTQNKHRFKRDLF